jgi:excisionase family DNA binding protein
MSASGMGEGSARRRSPTAALFVRIPSEQAQRLDRAAFELKQPKQQLVSNLLERFFNQESADSLRTLGSAGDSEGNRRVNLRALQPDEVALGHHAFHPYEQDVLTCAEAAELLRVDPELVAGMASAGELPGRELGGEWRFSREALLRWLAAERPSPEQTDAGTVQRARPRSPRAKSKLRDR